MSISTQKISNTYDNLNLHRIIRLVFSIDSKLAVLSIFLIILESLFWFGTMYQAKHLVNTVGKVNQATDQQMLINGLLTTFVIVVSYVAIKFITTLVTEYQAAKVSEYIDDKIHKKAIELDLSFYESPVYFDILKRAQEAGPDKPSAIIRDILDVFKNLMMVVAIGSILVTINWLILPLLTLFVVPSILFRIKLAKRLQAWNIQQTSEQRKASYFSSLITSDVTAKEIRLFRLGNYIREKYLDIKLALLKEQFAIKKRGATTALITSLLGILGVLSCISLIAFRALHGQSSVGDITIFIAVFMQSFTVLQSVGSGITKLYQNSIIVKGIFELFDLETRLETKKETIVLKTKDAVFIKLKNLHFSYPFAKKQTLRDINMEIPSGKIIALVGFNGSGKSTLIKLLCRLYDPSEGAILFNNEDIRNYSLESYQKQISAVFQDFVRYNVSVRDNIQFGNVNYPLNEERMKTAATIAGANQFITDLPQHYETLLGKVFEEGHEVSIGQWQKLAIARACYSDSKMIILDEATSALDALSEEQLFKNIRQNLGNRAALIISHRLSTIQQADYIYVMSEGTIKQSGKHEELIEQEGDYKRLFHNK